MSIIVLPNMNAMKFLDTHLYETAGFNEVDKAVCAGDDQKAVHELYTHIWSLDCVGNLAYNLGISQKTKLDVCYRNLSGKVRKT